MTLKWLYQIFHAMYGWWIASKKIHQCYPNIVSIIFTGYADFDAVMDMINSGAAYKFLSKHWINHS